MTELYDPHSHELQENPYPVYQALRDEHPAYYNEERDFWAISRFSDVWSSVHDPGTFSSAGGIVLGQDIMADSSELLPMLISMDPPRHDELRSLVNRGFTPKRVAALEAGMRQTTRELIAEFRDQGSFDLVQDFGAMLPTIVIADLLGVSRDDRKWFRHCSDILVQIDPRSEESIAGAMGTSMELYEYFGKVIEERRKNPIDDLVSVIVAAENEGDGVTEAELRGFCFVLLLAGNETTANLISNTAAALAQQPDVRRELLNDPSLLGNAVEEFLRYDSPVQGLARTLTRDFEMHGQTMRKGVKALLLFAAANRDEREFDNPDTLDIHRRIDRSVAFGHGIHYCLGASLARLEGRIAYEELLPVIGEYEVDFDNSSRLHSGPIRGYMHLPVSFKAA